MREIKSPEGAWVKAQILASMHPSSHAKDRQAGVRSRKISIAGE